MLTVIRSCMQAQAAVCDRTGHVTERKLADRCCCTQSVASSTNALASCRCDTALPCSRKALGQPGNMQIRLSRNTTNRNAPNPHFQRNISCYAGVVNGVDSKSTVARRSGSNPDGSETSAATLLCAGIMFQSETHGHANL